MGTNPDLLAEFEKNHPSDCKVNIVSEWLEGKGGERSCMGLLMSGSAQQLSTETENITDCIDDVAS